MSQIKFNLIVDVLKRRLELEEMVFYNKDQNAKRKYEGVEDHELIQQLKNAITLLTELDKHGTH